MIIIVSDNNYIQDALRPVQSFADTVIQTQSIFQSHDELKLLILDSGKKIDVRPFCPIIEIGRDLKKPFHILELVNLIEKHFHSIFYQLCQYKFYPSNHFIMNTNDEVVLKLTAKEAQLLEYLINKGELGANNVELLKNIWQYDEKIETSTVETHIYRLRQKLDSVGLQNNILLLDKRYYVASN